MKKVEARSYSEVSSEAVRIIIDQISEKPNSVICLPTGKTPLKMYKLLVKAGKRKEVDFSKVTFFNLDEYYPMDAKDKKSFSRYLFKNFFDKINAKKSNIHLLDGVAKDTEKECKNYEAMIKKNPIDLVVLGVGVNGHIAFNEPGSESGSKTRLVKLTPETKKVNGVDKDALTVGIDTIMKAKKIMLLASGKKKVDAVRNLFKGKVTKKCPVSLLRGHEGLIVIVDKGADS